MKKLLLFIKSILLIVFISNVALGQVMSPMGAETGKAPSTDPKSFEGVWSPRMGSFSLSMRPDIKQLPATKAILDDNNQKKEEELHVATAQTSCRTEVGAMAMFQLFSVKVVQDEKQIAILLEEPRGFRQIMLGNNSPAAAEEGLYRGYSFGHWEGDTLVVETTGSKGIGELDMDGLPYSEGMHISERYTKSEDGRVMQIAVTVTDLEYYAEPFTVQKQWDWAPGLEVAESDCSENPRGENDEGSFYRNELYKPSCYRVAGEGRELSYISCAYLDED